MPQLNYLGDVASGIGNSGVRINNQLIYSIGGNPAWLNDNEVIFQAGAATYKYNIVDQQVTLYLPQGANEIRANANVSAVFYNPNTTTSFAVLYSTYPFSIGVDGSILTTPYPDRTNLELWSRNGVIIRNKQFTYDYAFHYDKDNIFYVLGGNFYKYDGTRVNTHQPNWNASCFLGPDNRIWLCYQYEGVALIHPADDYTKGFRFGTDGSTYNPCAVTLNSAIIKVTWALNQGETEVEWIDLDLAEIQDLTGVDPMPSEVQTYPAYPRKIFFAPYHAFSAQYGDSPEYYGNCIWGALGPTDMAHLLSYEDYVANPHLLNVTLAWYMHVSYLDNHAIDTYRKLQGLPEKPIILYLDSRNWPDELPYWIDKNTTWVSFPCYRDVGESLAIWDQRMRNIFHRIEAQGLPIVLTPQFYDRNFTMPLDEVIANMNYFDAYIRDYFIVGVMPFAEMRPSGMVTYPILREYARAMFQASPGRPNRYDYWLASNWKEVLVNEKLNYTVLTLRGEEKQFLKKKLNHS